MKNLFDEMPQAIKEDEYLGQDGLIYCRECHSPRQKELDLGQRKLRVRCLCVCEAVRQEITRGELRRQEFQDKVARNRTVGLAESALRKCTFENDKGYNPEIAKARKYVENWEEMLASAAGLLFWGNVGTGKTYIAACIANALLDRGVQVMMTNFSRVLSDLPGMFSGDRNRYIDSFNRSPLLIIDDLGVERNSEFAREQVFSVIDSRYRSQLPMIVTTNLTPKEMKNPADLSRARIYDRVLERCTPIRVDNQNIREQNKADNLKKSKQLLRAT